jgi:hypothetical protein
LQVLDKTGIRYRYTDKFKVSRTYITTYCGGSVVDGFAPSQDQYIWFDEFESGTGDGSSCGGSFPPASPVAAPSRPAGGRGAEEAPSSVLSQQQSMTENNTPKHTHTCIRHGRSRPTAEISDWD